jgi:transposase
LKRSRWWLAGIRQAVSALQSYSLTGIWSLLKRLKLVYKRGRAYLHSPDPDYAAKVQAVAAAYAQAQAAPKRIVLLYQDEVTYYRRPTRARAYAPVGHHQALARLGYRANTKRRISGSLNAVSGHFHARQRGKFGLAELKREYQQLEAAYPEAEVIYLVQDNWPVHHHADLQALFTTSRIKPLFLPTYAPWTNPTEKVWLRLKQEVLHLHDLTDDWHGLQQLVQDWLVQWQQPSPDLLHSVGLTPY